jgi:hypothetical protein
VKVVTSAALGLRQKPNALFDAAALAFSSTVSIGNSLRYSMRCATSLAVGAESVPCTISPF